MDFSKITSEPYISGYTYRTFADHAICDRGDTEYMQKVCHGIDPKKVRNGDLLYVSGMEVDRFLRTIAPHIESDYFMITAQWDAGPDNSILSLLGPNLKKWWTINNHFPKHSQIEGIPLGLQNRHWRRDENYQSEPDTYTYRNDTPKSKGILCSYSIRNNVSERTECYRAARNAFGDSLTLHEFRPEDREDDRFVSTYFDLAAQHRFVLCPWGAGIDTHRLWESLYLGCIPIVKRHPVYAPFSDFPVLFINEWDELEKVDLDSAWTRYSYKLKTERRIYPGYWREKINDEHRSYTNRTLS